MEEMDMSIGLVEGVRSTYAERRSPVSALGGVWWKPLTPNRMRAADAESNGIHRRDAGIAENRRAAVLRVPCDSAVRPLYPVFPRAAASQTISAPAHSWITVAGHAGS
jgi:hypothetical protein